MPNKLFLETYPLYRKFKVSHIPYGLNQFEKVNINMSCPTCESNQTFVMKNEFWENENIAYMNDSPAGLVLRLVYQCSHCGKFERFFFIKIGPGNSEIWLMKIGQYPAWEIHGEPNVEKLLGTHAAYFKKGLICESQSYGIAAFSYYRRIVEEIIDELLDEIAGLLSGAELTNYQGALEKTKKNNCCCR